MSREALANTRTVFHKIADTADGVARFAFLDEEVYESSVVRFSMTSQEILPSSSREELSPYESSFP